MRKIIYEDCNNNVAFLKELFIRIQELSDVELSWCISNLDFIPIDRGDFFNGTLDVEMGKIFSFQKKFLDEHTIIMLHNEFIELLKNIKTIYEGDFGVIINGKQSKIKVFDGDIIEIDGDIEDRISDCF